MAKWSCLFVVPFVWSCHVSKYIFFKIIHPSLIGFWNYTLVSCAPKYLKWNWTFLTDKPGSGLNLVWNVKIREKGVGNVAPKCQHQKNSHWCSCWYRVMTIKLLKSPSAGPSYHWISLRRLTKTQKKIVRKYQVVQ